MRHEGDKRYLDKIHLFSSQEQVSKAVEGDYGKVFSEDYAERIIGGIVVVTAKQDCSYIVRPCIPFKVANTLIESDGETEIKMSKGDTIVYLVKGS